MTANDIGMLDHAHDFLLSLGTVLFPYGPDLLHVYLLQGEMLFRGVNSPLLDEVDLGIGSFADFRELIEILSGHFGLEFLYIRFLEQVPSFSRG
jgi:hypothetical protein